MSGLRSALAGPFDLRLRAGSATCIFGASGSGKSLFLRLVADLDTGEGEVMLDGVSRAALAGPQWRRRAPYVAAASGWWADTVQEHFAPPHWSAALALADRLGVERRAVEGPVSRLSTGERQRLALARALVLEPPVLLLDEPTGPLDPASVVRVEAVLAERMAAGAILLFASHDEAQAERLGAVRLRMIDRRLEPAA